MEKALASLVLFSSDLFNSLRLIVSRTYSKGMFETGDETGEEGGSFRDFKIFFGINSGYADKAETFSVKFGCKYCCCGVE